MQDKLVFLKVENLIRCTQPDTYRGAKQCNIIIHLLFLTTSQYFKTQSLSFTLLKIEQDVVLITVWWQNA